MSSSSVGATRLPPFTAVRLGKVLLKSLYVGELRIWEYFLGCFGEMGGEWICLGVVDLLGIISFFLRVVVGVSWLWAT